MNISESQIKEICKKCNYDLISFELLGIGAFNVNYLIITKQRKLVLRIENCTQYGYKKKNEYEILKSLNGKFGPKVYFFDNSKEIIHADYLIEEFIDLGEHPPAKASNEFIEVMGKWYKKLHRIKRKIEADKWDLEYSMNINYKKFCENKGELEEEHQHTIENLFVKGLEIIRQNRDIFSRRKYHSLLQGDPSRSNIFISENSIRIVDWEFAHYQVREKDLAFFVWSFDLDEKKKQVFLKAAGYSKTYFARKQFEITYIIHCFDMLIWMIERLRIIKEGKINPKLKNTTVKEVMEGIREDIQKIDITLKNSIF
ncbi:MAG: aminoglycoside phosphotransferase family protein [Candidatus Heimdallarchaeota archaeon]|nr:aminoglycoside phosphotransferase family protein [Candidatus Heimdallarchaeota archaeon]